MKKMVLTTALCLMILPSVYGENNDPLPYRQVDGPNQSIEESSRIYRTQMEEWSKLDIYDRVEAMEAELAKPLSPQLRRLYGRYLSRYKDISRSDLHKSYTPTPTSGTPAEIFNAFIKTLRSKSWHEQREAINAELYRRKLDLSHWNQEVIRLLENYVAELDRAVLNQTTLQAPNIFSDKMNAWSQLKTPQERIAAAQQELASLKDANDFFNVTLKDKIEEYIAAQQALLQTGPKK